MEILLFSSYFQKMHATANGLCAASVYDGLRKQGHNITVVCYRSGEDVEKADNIIEVEEKKEFGNTGAGVVGKWKAYGNTFKALFRPYIDKKLVQGYKNAAKKVIREKKVDMIVAFYFPLETAIAAAELKAEYPDVKTVIYELDSVGDGVLGQAFLEKRKAAAAERYLDKRYRCFDAVVVMRAHAAFWKRTHFLHLDKMRIADIPMIQSNMETKSITIPQQNPFSCIYAGLLDKQFRNPAYFLKLLSQINQKETVFTAHFYTKGDCEQLLKAEEEKTSYVKTHGYVTQKVLEDACANAACLISIGNASSHSVPSKIFSYISSGKPIIHITAQKQDVCIDYLNKYPLALVLNEDDALGENAEKIMGFLHDCKERTVKLQSIKETFVENTPEFSAKMIESVFCE